jgi:hypothetical protein
MTTTHGKCCAGSIVTSLLFPKAQLFHEVEQLRLVFYEYVCPWPAQGREIENNDDYNLNITANSCCEPFIYPDGPSATPTPSI